MALLMLSVIWVLSFGVADVAPEEPIHAAGPLEGRLRAIVDEHVESGEFSGVVLVAREGEPLIHEAFGVADESTGKPVTLDHRFKIFSTTKQFTASAVLLLHADGLLGLDDPIHEVIPESPPSWSGVTIHQLVTHTSGIRDHVELLLEHYSGNDGSTMLRVLEAIGEDPLVTDPGKEFRYSNFGYQLLLVIIERVSGKPYEEFLAERLFGPSGMESAGVDRALMDEGEAVEPAPVALLAQGYIGEPGEPRPTTSMMFVNLGAGGVYATAADILAYDDALRQGVPITPRMQMLGLERAFEIRRGVSYAYGWILRRPESGPMTLEHSGGTNGFTSQYLRAPKLGVCVIVLSNRGYAPVGAIAREMLEEVTRGAAP